MQRSKIKDQRSKKFDLEDRLIAFAQEVIVLCNSMPENAVNRPLVSQLIRSATSIGANYAEANNASSKRDFRNKLYISKKEAQETRYWLRLLSVAKSESKAALHKLEDESHQICLILQSIANKLNDEKT